MEILYRDKDVVVCRKEPGILSTDEPGGMPELLRRELGTDNIRSVHRLDRVVGGLMVYALRAKAASELSRQIRQGEFRKEYLALVQGQPEKQGTLRHWLLRDAQERKTYAVSEDTPRAQEAILHYRVLKQQGDLALVRIRLETGRTHQIRCQFASSGWPLVGDRKYGGMEADQIGLFSCYLGFRQPYSAQPLEFQGEPTGSPWDMVVL